MKLLTEVPELEAKIQDGSITLSNAAQAQKLFQTEAKLDKPFELDEKKKILEALTHKTSREAERELIQHSSQPISLQRPDQIKPVTATHSEIRFVADQSLLDQLELIKGLLANKHPHLSLSQLIAEMAKLSLDKLQPKPPKVNPSKNFSDAGVNPPEVKTQAAPSVRLNTQANPEKPASRYISTQVKRAVFQRDQGKCQYVDQVTGRKCASSHAIQYDHSVPFALGGQSTVENLEITCSMHNRIRSIEVYGQKMGAYFKLD